MHMKFTFLPHDFRPPMFKESYVRRPQVWVLLQNTLLQFAELHVVH